jgi:hypothetical protein
VAEAEPDRLPNAEHAIVELRRVRDYLLNPNHQTGGPKARFFIAHGFSHDGPEAFCSALLMHGRANDVLRRVDTPWGSRYTIVCHCRTPDGRDPCIRSVWQMDGDLPRLLTVIPRS